MVAFFIALSELGNLWCIREWSKKPSRAILRNQLVFSYRLFNILFYSAFNGIYISTIFLFSLLSENTTISGAFGYKNMTNVSNTNRPIGPMCKLRNLTFPATVGVLIAGVLYVHKRHKPGIKSRWIIGQEPLSSIFINTTAV